MRAQAGWCYVKNFLSEKGTQFCQKLIESYPLLHRSWSHHSQASHKIWTDSTENCRSCAHKVDDAIYKKFLSVKEAQLCQKLSDSYLLPHSSWSHHWQASHKIWTDSVENSRRSCAHKVSFGRTHGCTDTRMHGRSPLLYPPLHLVVAGDNKNLLPMKHNQNFKRKL